MKETSNLDLLLISPPIFYSDNNNIWKEITSNFPPLGLVSIAGHVKSLGYLVKIIDCNIESPTVDVFEKYFVDNYVNKYKKITNIGLSSMTCTIKKAYKIAEICHKYYPNSKIIFGGVHPTFMFEEVINHPLVDIVSVGEGEITIEEITKGVDLKKINGIVYKNKNKIIKNPPRKRILDLNKIAMPAYDLLPISKYKPAKGSYKRLPAMAMMTSRGCPGQCTFCSKALGDIIVAKSAKTIYKEIIYLIDNYKIKEILFYDDTFTVFRDNVHELCNLLIDNKIDITWTCFARVDYVDKELLSRMKKAGCHQIMYGVENINAQVLKNIQKKINKQQVENACKWTKEAGIECRVAFMVGNPGDNPQIIKDNIKFIKKIKPDLLIANIATPFPGTKMYSWAKEKDLILTYDWDDYTLAKPIMKLENLDTKEIEKLYKTMYKSFYFSPKYIIKKILSIRSINDFIINFQGFKSVVFFYIKKTL